MTRRTYTAGFLIRRDFRAALDQVEASWREYKGLLDSVFVVEAPPQVHQAIRSWIAKIVNEETK